MAQYKVTIPDGTENGTTIEFEGPEGATDDQLREIAKELYKAEDYPEAVVNRDAPGPEAEPIGSPLSAAVIGAGDFLTGGMLDEIDAGLTTLLPGQNSYWSAPEGRSFGEQFDLNLQQSDGAKQAVLDAYPGPAIAGSVGGMIAGGALGGTLGATGIGARATAALPSWASAPIATDALLGSVYGFGNDNENRLKGGVTGAAVNALGGAVGRTAVRGVSNVLAPAVPEAVRRLNAAGVTMTPGQIFGAGGAIGRAVKSVEDKATSLPVVGDAINAARRVGIEDMNRVAVSKALAPIAEEVPPNTPPGRSLLEWAQTKLDDAYDRALAGFELTADDIFKEGLANVGNSINQLTAGQADEVRSVMQRTLGPYAANPISGAQLQSIKRGLNDKIASYRGSPEPRNHDIADTLEAVRDQFMDLASRQAPENAQMFRAADSAYANFTAIERAAAKSKTDGIFSPEQLAQGVRESDRSVRKRAFASGQARLQDLSDDAKSVLPSTYPDSGTVGRALLLAGAGGFGGSYLNDGDVTTNALAGVALAAPFTPAGRRIIQSTLISRPDVLRRAGEQVRRFDALGGTIGSGLALGYASR